MQRAQLLDPRKLRLIKDEWMKRKPNSTRSVPALVLGLITVALLQSRVVMAQTAADDWQFRGMIYGYLPTIGGSTAFPAGVGSDVSVDAKKILNNLKFTFMGSLEAQKGSWGAFTDILYLNVGGSKSGNRDLTIGGADLPAGITANASLDIKGTVWTLGGNYRVVAT